MECKKAPNAIKLKKSKAISSIHKMVLKITNFNLDYC